MAEAGNPTLMDEDAAIAEVLLPVAIDRLYSYLVPRGIVVAPGDFVEVPLGTRMTHGVVWEARPGTRERANLKAIGSRFDIPPLPANLRKFVDWVARWTLSPRGMVLRMAIGAPFQAGPEPARVGVRLAGPAPHRMTPTRARYRRGGRRPCFLEVGARRGRRLFERRHRQFDRRRHARDNHAAARARGACLRSGFRQAIA
jgi:primosomal protein N'